MKKLIDALHIIQEECINYINCEDCPMYSEDAKACAVTYVEPAKWIINDYVCKVMI